MSGDAIAMPVNEKLEPATPRGRLRVAQTISVDDDSRRLVFVVDNAALVELDDDAATVLSSCSEAGVVDASDLFESSRRRLGDDRARETLAALGRLEILSPVGAVRASGAPIEVPAPSSLVLHVAEDCNMRCAYCYADFGRHGGEARLLDPARATAFVDAFFDGLERIGPVHVTFFGGEPLLNVSAIRAAHAHAKARAAREGRSIAFALTTNGTLLSDELVDFFRRERFALTISIDGARETNDHLRVLPEGDGAYARIRERVRTMAMPVDARVTLTRMNVDVVGIVHHLASIGFRRVGVSPVVSGDPRLDLGADDLGRLAAGISVLADEFVDFARRGLCHPFTNLRTLFAQIAAGEARRAPCGAAARLVAVDGSGNAYACHRFVGVDAFQIGNLMEGGLDRAARLHVLADMNPASREPCAACFARTLCGGGCHHIAWMHSNRGTAPWQLDGGFCDFLRGWYRLGLETYARTIRVAPHFVGELGCESDACALPHGP